MNILITGGASGLGESITKALSKNTSNTVYFTYNKSKENAIAIEKEFNNTKSIYFNFEDENSLQSLINAIDQLHLHVLINNAITGFDKNYFHKLSAENFLISFNKNIIPVIKITQKSILFFRKQKSGKIITILSSAIINRPPIGWSEYVAEKNYLLSLSKSWAVENINFNITSNCVSPAFMQTQLTSDIDNRIVEELANKHPLKKLLTTEEVAETVLFLVNSTKHINGSNIIINAASDII